MKKLYLVTGYALTRDRSSVYCTSFLIASERTGENVRETANEKLLSQASVETYEDHTISVLEMPPEEMARFGLKFVDNE